MTCVIPQAFTTYIINEKPFLAQFEVTAKWTELGGTAAPKVGWLWEGGCFCFLKGYVFPITCSLLQADVAEPAVSAEAPDVPILGCTGPWKIIISKSYYILRLPY